MPLCPVQLVNYAQFTQTIALRIRNSPVPISNLGNITVLTGVDYRSTNSFEDPYNVSPACHFDTLDLLIAHLTPHADQHACALE